MSYVVKEIRWQELIECLLAGLKLKECAAHLRVTHWTIIRDVKDEKFRALLKERSEDTFNRRNEELVDAKSQRIQRAEELATDALEKMGELLQSQSEQMQYKAAQDLMDRDKELTKNKNALPPNNMPAMVNAVFLQQAAAAIREEKSVNTTAEEVVQ